jgi:hypothetical protein
LAAFIFVLTSDLIPKELAAFRKQETGMELMEVRRRKVEYAGERRAADDLGAATVVILVWNLKNGPRLNIFLGMRDQVRRFTLLQEALDGKEFTET